MLVREARETSKKTHGLKRVPIPPKVQNALVVRLKTSVLSGGQKHREREKTDASDTLDKVPLRLGSRLPLGLADLNSTLGSFLRAFGLRIAVRIDNCKVCLRTKNPRPKSARSVNIYENILGRNTLLLHQIIPRHLSILVNLGFSGKLPVTFTIASVVK